MEGLPKKGIITADWRTFWTKTPLFHTVIDGKRVLLLKYNKLGQAEQHDLKYRNTVSILKEFGRHPSSLFPEMFAHCDDAGDGFHYILVEHLALHYGLLPKPSSFSQCVERAKRVLQMYVELDEGMHLTFMDVKNGQWMARNETSFVLQDVDDVVRAPWRPSDMPGDVYEDQVLSAKRQVQDQMPPSTTAGQVDRLWDERFFPHGFTIRYSMILIKIVIMEDLGFKWDTDCEARTSPKPASFDQCLKDLFAWTATPEDNWPAPKQVLRGLEECAEHGRFTKTTRAPAPWRDFPPVSTNKQYMACKRPVDILNKAHANYTRNVQWCGGDDGRTLKSCCRAKSAEEEPCYYWIANQTLCTSL